MSVNYTITKMDKTRSRVKVVTWELAQSESGEVFPEIILTDAVVHINGTFGGASVALRCSADGETNNTIISFSAPGVIGLQGPVRNFLPVVTGGGGSTDITVELVTI